MACTGQWPRRVRLPPTGTDGVGPSLKTKYPPPPKVSPTIILMIVGSPWGNSTPGWNWDLCCWTALLRKTVSCCLFWATSTPRWRKRTEYHTYQPSQPMKRHFTRRRPNGKGTHTICGKSRSDSASLPPAVSWETESYLPPRYMCPKSASGETQLTDEGKKGRIFSFKSDSRLFFYSSFQLVHYLFSKVKRRAAPL